MRCQADPGRLAAVHVNRVILASASPRRRELLGALVEKFEVRAPDLAEELGGDPSANATRLAVAKARAVATGEAGAIVLGSDTIVHDGQRPYGKPDTPQEASKMLALLAGREHIVVTAVAVVSDGPCQAGARTTVVRMAPLTPDAIAAYVASGRPMDKAGAYAIQDDDVPTVASIEGCYCNVMGLPLWLTKRLLESAGVTCSDPSLRFGRCSSCPDRAG